VAPLEEKYDTIFYDGHCALCHSTVKFALRHDRSGTAFRFAPLQGDTFKALVAPELRNRLPDSIVVRTQQGALLVRSDAIIYTLRRLGGGWRFLASTLAIFPRSLRDGGYNFIARIRYRVFGKREDLCPVVPPDQRQRFFS